jgi:hypothetical protein
MFSARRASSSRPGNVTCFIASTTVLPSFVGWTVSTALGAERGGDAPDAGLEAGVVAEQVDRHTPAGGEDVEAGAVERGAVEHRARRLVVVEIDARARRPCRAGAGRRRSVRVHARSSKPAMAAAA